MEKNRSFIVFCVKLMGSYAVWKLVYYLLETRDPAYWGQFKDAVAARTVQFAAWLDNNLLQVPVGYNPRNLIIEGHKGIFLADHCIGIPAYVVFSLFIAIYSGKWYHKLWFIPLGVAGIFFINSFRIAALAYLQKNTSEGFFQFNHSYTYLVTSYGLIFLFIIWWVEVFASDRDLVKK
jgi:exosortase/archaeosortase family protein